MPAPSPLSDPATDPRLLLLHADDNVLIARAPIAVGECVLVEGERVVVPTAMPIAHKLARRQIRAGEKVTKYGAPIGTATSAIARGAHVHVHNLRSDYTQSITLAGAVA